MHTIINNRLLQIAIITTCATASVALISYSYKALFTSDAWETNTISVSGEAERTMIPDVATFTLSVRAEGAEVSVVQTEVAEIHNEIVAFLKEKGVAETDIKTITYNVSPRYQYEQAMCTPMFCPPGKTVQDGFEVLQSLEVKVRQTEQAGELLAGVGSFGATDISGLTFTIDDKSKILAEAREAAILDAREKANVLAGALGVRLVRLVGFYEEDGGMPMAYYGMGGDAMTRSSMEMAIAPDIQLGESVVKSRVTVTYRIK
jgi:uncharacterized protein